jgi:hypothetical protein
MKKLENALRWSTIGNTLKANCTHLLITSVLCDKQEGAMGLFVIPRNPHQLVKKNRIWLINWSVISAHYKLNTYNDIYNIKSTTIQLNLINVHSFKSNHQITFKNLIRFQNLQSFSKFQKFHKLSNLITKYTIAVWYIYSRNSLQ